MHTTKVSLDSPFFGRQTPWEQGSCDGMTSVMISRLVEEPYKSLYVANCNKHLYEI